MVYDSGIRDPLSSLSEGQLDVLKRVALHQTSKVIGRELGISHNTVDQRIKRIQFLLGVPSRFDAARIYLEARGVPDHEDMRIIDSNAMHDAAPPTIRAGLLPQQDNGNSTTMRDAQAHYFAGHFEPRQETGILHKLLGDGKNTLGFASRTVVIFAIMFLGIFALSVLVNLVEGMSRIL